MADTYLNFADLKAHEQLGVSYEIELVQRHPEVIIMTPHGGGIESGASELVNAISSDRFSKYIFESKLTYNNVRNHVTSTHYDEPLCLNLMAQHSRAISVHGYSDKEVKNTIVGGLDEELIAAVIETLQRNGFNVERASDRFTATNPNNIVNRTSTSKGVQLELSTAQRAAFFANGDLSRNVRTDRKNWTSEMYEYFFSIQEAIDKVVNV